MKYLGDRTKTNIRLDKAWDARLESLTSQLGMTKNAAISLSIQFFIVRMETALGRREVTEAERSKLIKDAIAQLLG